MLNPYEPPQTISFPVAEIVLSETISAARVAASLKELAQAGSSYCVGIYCGILVIVLSFFFREPPPTYAYGLNRTSSATWFAMFAFFCLVVSIVFFGWGILRQASGCRALEREFPEETLTQLFRHCRTASWPKAVLLGCLLFVPVWEGPGYWCFSLPLVAVWAWYALRSLYLHAQVFEFFQRILHQPRNAMILFRFQGCGFCAVIGTALLFALNIAQFNQHQQMYYPGFLCLAFLWAVTLHLYTLEYRRFQETLYRMI